MVEIYELKHELETQDNRFTDNPLFVVCSKREYPTSYDYSYDRSYYHDSDGEVAETKEDLIKYLIEDESIYEQEKIRNKLLNFDDHDFERYISETYSINPCYVFEVTQFEQAFLTEKGAEEYLRSNGHNLRKPFIYVVSMYRNIEMQNVRKYFMETNLK